MSSKRTEKGKPMLVPVRPCLNPRCQREGKNRGLCSSDASRMWMLIHIKKELTEQEAVENGKMLPKQRTFTDWALDFKKGA